jgi:signal transduction histidine kinase
MSHCQTQVGADGRRNPAILYGLGNILENAVDFAQSRVEVTADWSDEDVAVTISDDGPGFAPRSWTGSASPMCVPASGGA